MHASKFFNNAPPPVITIPVSTISAANSGSAFSNATLTASIITFTGLFYPSHNCNVSILICFGIPSCKLLPFI